MAKTEQQCSISFVLYKLTYPIGTAEITGVQILQLFWGLTSRVEQTRIVVVIVLR